MDRQQPTCIKRSLKSGAERSGDTQQQLPGMAAPASASPLLCVAMAAVVVTIGSGNDADGLCSDLNASSRTGDVIIGLRSRDRSLRWMCCWLVDSTSFHSCCISSGLIRPERHRRKDMMMTSCVSVCVRECTRLHNESALCVMCMLS